nr:MAG TPA: hypothetical protein [Caudoviricetes sp.]
MPYNCLKWYYCIIEEKTETTHFVGCLFYAQNLARRRWIYWAKSTTETICG